ncbi:MAG: PilZ domain-containing protein [Bdellovibrionales bacterium]|nr:PilZ domain-containing protein [Bdellovibrionales bacterium]
MTQKRKLRLTTRFQEIYDLLSRSVEKDGCFIWKSSDRKRLKIPVMVVQISNDQSVIQVRQSSIHESIQMGEVLYLKLPFRDAALKTRVVERVGAKLTLEFPVQLALEEGRKNPRFYFHPSEEKNAQVRTLVNRAKVLPERLHNVLVCDISKGGMAVFIPTQSRQFFDVKDKIRLTALGIHRFDVLLRGEVLFKVPFDIKGTLANRSGYKIGIQFEQELDQASLERFLQKRNLFSITDEQIVRDEGFRREIVSHMADIKKTLSSRKAFKELFDAFDRSKAENHYLKQHVHLLCQVMTGLGTRLGWISERSVDKLIYVAYLHDVRFSAMPHLARIQNKREFEKLKHTLTEAEQKAFLEAPMYAAELARMDLESYPDAIKILEQQKELPDGTGFPHGMSASFIAPLSALFIVSHYFVDYVIDHPDWTARDFVKTYQHKLKGQYFQKALRSMIE